MRGFRSGRATVCFRYDGTKPDVRNKFMIFLMLGRRESRYSYTSDIWIGSSSQEKFLASSMIFLSSSLDVGQISFISFLENFAVSLISLVQFCSSIFSRVFFILVIKKSLEDSASFSVDVYEDRAGSFCRCISSCITRNSFF